MLHSPAITFLPLVKKIFFKCHPFSVVLTSHPPTQFVSWSVIKTTPLHLPPVPLPPFQFILLSWLNHNPRFNLDLCLLSFSIFAMNMVGGKHTTMITVHFKFMITYLKGPFKLSSDHIRFPWAINSIF